MITNVRFEFEIEKSTKMLMVRIYKVQQVDQAVKIFRSGVRMHTTNFVEHEMF